MPSIEILRSLQIFKGLTDDELAQLDCCCEEIELDGDSVIFKENEAAEYLYTLLDGKVAIRYRLPFLKDNTEHSIALIEPGGTFGWSSLRTGGRYRFSAYCEKDKSKTLRCEKGNLVAVLENNHAIGYKVMKNLAMVAGSRFVAFQNEIARRDGQDFMNGW